MLLCLLGGLSMLAGVSDHALAAEGWQAGAAKITITPEKPMWMAGYASRTKPADGAIHDLWAKALVLKDAAGHEAVVVTLDLVGIDRELAQSVCSTLKKNDGLQREQIAFCTSHTHSGPVVGKVLRPMHEWVLEPGQKKLVHEYSAWLEQRILDVVRAARKDVAPASLAWASGQTDFAVNRRENKEPEVPQRRASGMLQGPVDHDVPVLAVNDADGKLKAVLFGYACHATVLSGQQWCADYPGFAQIELEKAHPGCIALFWAGCGADQNPIPRRTVELAEKYGKQLAAAVEKELKKGGMPIQGELQLHYAEIPVALDRLPTREELERDTSNSNKYVAARAKMLLADIDAGHPLSPTYPYPIAVWKLGKDVTWVQLGGEVVVDYALRLKQELSGDATWVAGYTNDVMAYIPSRRVLQEGGYEGGGAMVYYGLPAIWSPTVEETIVRGVHKLAK
jgi:hypothetical protein